MIKLILVKYLNILLFSIQANVDTVLEVIPGYVGESYDAAAWSGCLAEFAQHVIGA